MKKLILLSSLFAFLLSVAPASAQKSRKQAPGLSKVENTSATAETNSEISRKVKWSDRQKADKASWKADKNRTKAEVKQAKAKKGNAYAYGRKTNRATLSKHENANTSRKEVKPSVQKNKKQATKPRVSRKGTTSIINNK